MLKEKSGRRDADVHPWGAREYTGLLIKSGRRDSDAHPWGAREYTGLVIKSGRRDSDPRISAWKADALPLGHARNITLILPSHRDRSRQAG